MRLGEAVLRGVLDSPGGLMGAYGRTEKKQVAVRDTQPLQPTAVTPPHRRFGDISKINGAELMEATATWFGYWARYSKLTDKDSVSGWTFMTHLRDETGRPTVSACAKLMMLGESGCGKSTVLQLLNMVCARTDGLADEPTEPAFRSMMGPEQLTGLLDEADVLLGNGNRKAAIRAILNACTNPNGYVSRIQSGRRVKDYVFGPVAIAALPYLEVATGSWLEPLLNRSIIIRMEKPAKNVPQILESEEGQSQGALAKELISAWVQYHHDSILARIPTIEMPEGALHRKAQIWKPLLAIFDECGGEWPDRGREACIGKNDAGSLEEFKASLAALPQS